MKPSIPYFSRFQLLILSLLLVTGLSCGGSGDSSDDDDDGVTAAQCDTTCEHVYEECELALIDESGETLTQAECETSCLDQEETLVDCLEDVTCTEAAVNACLEETDEEDADTDEDECDSDSDCNESEEECVAGNCVQVECTSASDCSGNEDCIDNNCI